jgi:hypothetical protein
MKIVITLISFCILLPLVCANGGKVKTIDGKQIPKDSVAELELSGVLGSMKTDSVMRVHAVKVDTVAVSELVHGRGFQWTTPATLIDSTGVIARAVLEWVDASQLEKVIIIPGSHTITIRCAGDFRRSGFSYAMATAPCELSFEALSKHKYRLRVKYNWEVEIEDKTAKTVVVSKLVPPK